MKISGQVRQVGQVGLVGISLPVPQALPGLSAQIRRASCPQ
jgi:hypothetical protein